MLSTMPGRVHLPPMAGFTCTYKVSTYCNFLPSFSSSLFIGNECEDSAMSAMPLGCMGAEGWFRGGRNKRWDDVMGAEREDPISIQNFWN